MTYFSVHSWFFRNPRGSKLLPLGSESPVASRPSLKGRLCLVSHRGRGGAR